MIYYPDGNPAENGLLITPQMIEESNLDGLGHEVHTMDGAIAIISDEMEALELIHTANMLKALRNKLLDHLGNLCGKCDGCVQYGGKCWAKELEDQVVRVPDWAKKAAGIPLDANLVCAIDDCCIDNIAKGVLKQWRLEDAAQLPRDGSVILLDTRTVKEFEAGHIEGFVNIPVDELRERLDEIEAGKTVYVICQSGLRSYIASRILEGNGFDVYNFAGGFRFYDAVMKDRALIEQAMSCGMDK